MSWYYAQANQPQGPVDDSQFESLIAGGVIRANTLVWRHGMKDWQPLAAVRPEFAPPASAIAGPRPAAAAPRPVPVAKVPVARNPVANPVPSPASNAAPNTNDANDGGNARAAIVPDQSAAASETPAASSPSASPQAWSAPTSAASSPTGAFTAPSSDQSAWGGSTRVYAGFWIRFLARIIDGVILNIAFGIVFSVPMFMILGPRMSAADPSNSLAFLAFVPVLFAGVVLVQLIYEVAFLVTKGATPGKMVLGLRVVPADGGRISMGLAVGRYFAHFLSGMILSIGYIMAAFDDRKRALHDRICNTFVIRTKS
jgi:uncharacterized RDD family membrane protein YckC